MDLIKKIVYSGAPDGDKTLFTEVLRRGVLRLKVAPPPDLHISRLRHSKRRRELRQGSLAPCA